METKSQNLTPQLWEPSEKREEIEAALVPLLRFLPENAS